MGKVLLPIAQVQVFRGGSPVGPVLPATMKRMLILSGTIAFTVEGTAQRRTVLVDQLSDVVPGDDMVFVTINGLPPRKPGPFEVEDVVEDNGGMGLDLLEVFLVGF